MRFSIFARILLAAFPTALLAGCSAFGVATRGDLEKQQAAWELRRQEFTVETAKLRAELEDVSRELVDFRGELEPRLATLEGDVAGIERIRDRVDGLARRLEDAKQQLTILQGETRKDLARLSDEVLAASSEAAQAQGLAHSADERGRRVTDAYLEGLRAERKRLRRDLEEIEELLDDWGERGTEEKLSLQRSLTRPGAEAPLP